MSLLIHHCPDARGTACALALMLALLIVGGCRSEPKAQPLATPALSASAEVFRGSPLGSEGFPGPGPSSAPAVSPGSDMPMVAEARWYLAAAQFLAPERSASASLASRATLVISADEERPWQATPRRLAGVRMLGGEAAGATAARLQGAPATSVIALGEGAAAFRGGLTAAFHLEGDAALNGVATAPAASATSAYLTLLPADDQGSLRVQLALAAEEAGRARELVVTDWPDDAPGAPVLLIFPPARGQAGSTVLWLSVREADSAADAELLAAADTAATGKSSPSPVLAPSSLAVALQGAAAAMADADSRRAALAFLARETDASLAEELALAADDDVLAAVTKRLAERWQEALPAPAVLGFELEREALSALAELDDAGNLPAEMRTLLTVHAGEAGRRAASLQEVLRGATSLAELRSILAAENAIYLEDSEAAARVRAFEWLEARGRAPAGYDPLASREARRAALNAAMAPAAQPPQTRPADGGPR